MPNRPCHTHIVSFRSQEATIVSESMQQAALSWPSTVSPQLMARWTFGSARPKATSFPDSVRLRYYVEVLESCNCWLQHQEPRLLLQLPRRQRGDTGSDSTCSRDA